MPSQFKVTESTCSMEPLTCEDEGMACICHQNYCRDVHAMSFGLSGPEQLFQLLFSALIL